MEGALLFSVFRPEGLFLYCNVPAAVCPLFLPGGESGVSRPGGPSPSCKCREKVV